MQRPLLPAVPSALTDARADNGQRQGGQEGEAQRARGRGIALGSLRLLLRRVCLGLPVGGQPLFESDEAFSTLVGR